MTVKPPDRADVFTWSYFLDNEADERGGCWPDRFQLGVSEIVGQADGSVALVVYIESTGEVFNLPFVRDADLADVCWIDVPADDTPSVLVALANPTRSTWSGWQWQRAAQAVQPGWHAFVNSDGTPPTTSSS